MATRLSLLALIMVVNVGCTPMHATKTSTSAPQPQRLCDVLLNRAEHESKEVVVEAVFQQTPHGMMLFSEDCKSSFTHFEWRRADNAPNDATRAKDELLREKPHRRIKAVVRGVFRVANKFECFGSNCLSYKIEVIELLSVSTIENH